MRIAYVGVCGSDVKFWTSGGINTPLSEPLIMGHEAAGTIQSVGRSVTSLAPGDAVALEPGIPCRRCTSCKAGHYNFCGGMRFAAAPPDAHGMLTKYYKLSEDFCYKLVGDVRLQEGVLVEPLAVAVHMARLVDVRFGDRVVVYGAGTVGLLCSAVAKVFGASKIVVVDVVERKLEFAKMYVAGARTFLPEKVAPEENARRLIESFDLKNGADVVMEATGAEPCIQAGVHALRKGGR